MSESNDPSDDRAELEGWDVLLEQGFGEASAGFEGQRAPAATDFAEPLLVEPESVDAARPLDLESPDAPAGERLLGRYELFGEFARGGVGVLFHARDQVLRRDVAVKILLARHRDRPELHRRFLEEAQICAQLQHPGIVPLHDAGLTSDGRPFLAMKLIRGETLAARLAQQAPSAERRSELVRILIQVCHAVAYAHARGVVHRDLKPGNVMVGAFGEVQVMDFGMAKVLAREEPAAPSTPRERQPAPVTTVRSEDPSSNSVSGSVMGTYAYMPPEQAAGDLERVGPRADVFSLGAILCELLTGAPPYRGEREAVRLKASTRDLSEADERLRACEADPELVALCRRCLSASPENRPKDAGELAALLEGYVGGLEQRAREQQIAAARAEEQLLAERKRRRLQVALLVSILALAGFGAGAWGYLESERAGRAARAAEAVDRSIAAARAAQPRAEASTDVAEWAAILASARQAVELASGPDADESVRGRAAGFLHDMEALERERLARHAQSELDARTRARLLEIDESLTSTWRWERHDDEYAAAYREHGLDIAERSEAELAQAIAASAIAADLIVGLDRWAQCKVMRKAPDEQGKAVLRRLLELADPDPLRLQIRAASANKDRTLALQLARECDAARIGPVRAAQLASTLWALGETREAIRLDRAVLVHHPGDFALNFQAGMLLSQSGLGQPAEIIRYDNAALAARPHSLAAANNLAVTLAKSGQRLEAIEILRRMLTLHGELAWTNANLGAALEGERRYDDALECYRKVLALEPEDPRAHENVARALKRLGRLDEARAAFDRAFEAHPRDASLLLSYGAMLCDQLDDSRGAVAAFERVVELAPEDRKGWRNLGVARRKSGDLEGALAAYRALLALEPGSADALDGVGETCAVLERFEEARDAFSAAMAIDPENGVRWSNLAITLGALGESVAALEAVRKACAYAPDFVDAWSNLGQWLGEAADWAGAEAAFARAVELRPLDVELRFKLGCCELENDHLSAAAASFRKVLELQPDYPNAREALAAAESGGN